MAKTLLLFSGGTDSQAVLHRLVTHSNKEELSTTLLHLVIGGTAVKDKVEGIAGRLGLELVELPYYEIRKKITGYSNASIQCWMMETHFRAIQYAYEHDYDTILSGHLNLHFRVATPDSSEFDQILVDIQNLLEAEKLVEVIRPLKGFETRKQVKEWAVSE